MDVVVVVSADAEWSAVREFLPDREIEVTPFGEAFRDDLLITQREYRLAFLHGGWGKIAAAASTQYAIDRWQPELLVNLGTCGGFAGQIPKGEILVVERTLVYDIFEQMGDADSDIDHYTTNLDLSWLEEPYPGGARRGFLISGDRDLVPGEINHLRQKYGAIAGDWESGAIAYVAQRNGTDCLILRGVSDLVSEQGGEAYENPAVFESSARQIMKSLLEILPEWIKNYFRSVGTPARSHP